MKKDAFPLIIYRVFLHVSARDGLQVQVTEMPCRKILDGYKTEHGKNIDESSLKTPRPSGTGVMVEHAYCLELEDVAEVVQALLKHAKDKADKRIEEAREFREALSGNLTYVYNDWYDIKHGL